MTYYDVEILTEKVTLLVTPPQSCGGPALPGDRTCSNWRGPFGVARAA
jgi:hypothetical protein